MLVLPKEDQIKANADARQGLMTHFNSEMEKIINANTEKDVYWILGKVKFPEEYGGSVGKTFLEACLDKPPVIMNSFVYEVDNRRGVKTLLWIMNPDGSLRLPTINKTISVQSTKNKRAKKGVIV